MSPESSCTPTLILNTLNAQNLSVADRRGINRNARQHTQIIRLLLTLAFSTLILFFGTSTVRASVFTQNQRLVGGTSPTGVVQWDWDLPVGGPVVPNPLPVGYPVSIVYGIQVPTGNPNAVAVTITLPPSFTLNSGGMRCFRYSGPSNPPSAGAQFACSLATVNIPAFTQANDKVIVIFDGYFNAAGTVSASFVPSGGALGSGSEPKGLSFDPQITSLPVDLAITKQVKSGTGAYGSTSSVAITPTSGTLKYKLRITNNSAPDPTYHKTDMFLGRLLKINDKLSTPGSPQDIVVNVSLQNFQCTKSVAAVDCPNPGGGSWSFYANNDGTFQISYPNTSNGFLPAGEWFEITFDAIVSTPSLCSPSQTNKLRNIAWFTYSDGTTTLSDLNPGNNTSVLTAANLLTPGLPTVCPPPVGIQVTKTVVTTGSWTTPFTYKITITNTNSVPLSGLTLADYVKNASGPAAFTATPSNIFCTPSCSAAPVSNSLLLNPLAQGVQLTASFNPLAPNATQSVQYDVQYSAPCASSSGPTGITNFASVSGPASGAAVANVTLPAPPICPFQVTKTQTSGPANFSTYPATFGYTVVFKNTSPTQTINVRTVIDSIAQDSAAYGTIDIDYSYACTANGVTGASPLTYTSPASPQPQMAANNPVWAGTRLIDFSSSTGVTFNPLGTLTCSVTVKLKQPPANDSKCQGAGNPGFVNSAFMDMSYPYNTNLAATPVFYAKVIRPLPKCVSIMVGKTVSPNVVAGSPMFFTLTVKNTGNDPTPTNIHLLDTLPTGFTFVSWSCSPVTACSGAQSSSINATLAPIPAGGVTTMTVNAIAPNTPGSYCNTDNATFNPFPPLTFFEGNQATLTTASACLQVSPPPPSPPKVTKKFEPNVISNGQPVKLTFTITNAAGNGPQTGLSFIDALPSPPFTTSTLFSNTCGGNPVVGTSVVGLSNGSLPAGPSSCTITFVLAPPTQCGVFTNNKKNFKEFSNVNVSEAAASLTVHCEPVKGELTKVALGVPPNFAGSFNFNVSCTPPGGPTTTTVANVTFAASHPWVTLKGGKGKTKTISIGTFQPGTVCTVAEQTPLPPVPPGCVWSPPSYIPASAASTAGPDPIKLTVVNRLTCELDAGPPLNKVKPRP